MITEGMDHLVQSYSQYRPIQLMYCYRVPETVRKDLRKQGISVSTISLRNPCDFFNYLYTESAGQEILIQ